MEVDTILSLLIKEESVVFQECQYVITDTRHIKIRKGIDNYGDKYVQVSKYVYSLTHGRIMVPKVIEIGKIDEYDYIISERIIKSRETTNQDIENILCILEEVEVPEILGLGPIIEKPYLLVENNREEIEISEKLDKIGYKQKEKILKLFKNRKETTKYTFQHGDLRHRNIMISEDHMYLLDLDTVGIYPFYFERFYITSYLGIPVSIKNISDDVLKMECIISCCNTINYVTLKREDIIATIKLRLDLILEGRTSGINNIIQGLNIAIKFSK